MFRLVPDPQSQRDVDHLAQFFNTLGLRIGGQDREDIGAAVRAGFAQNFVLQRSAHGAWAALRPGTVQQRQQEGFPGSRPILFRRGSYRDSFAEGGALDHFSQAWNSSHMFTLEEGSNDLRVPFLEGGTGNMAARPVTDLDSGAESDIGDAIEDMMHRLLVRESL